MTVPMANKDILKLFAGYKRFRHKYYEGDSTLYQRLSSSPQTPKVLIIGCSDSRVDPAIISSANPGDLFVVRNVANLVPPYETSEGFHGVSAAIEFAVVNLQVENVIILGHRQCGGIRALVQGQHKSGTSFVGKWIRMADEVREKVMQRYAGESEDTLCQHCEKEAIIHSVKNLKTFPFVQEAINQHRMLISGVYFDLESGTLQELDDATGEFRIVE